MASTTGESTVGDPNSGGAGEQQVEVNTYLPSDPEFHAAIQSVGEFAFGQLTHWPLWRDDLLNYMVSRYQLDYHPETVHTAQAQTEVNTSIGSAGSDGVSGEWTFST